MTLDNSEGIKILENCIQSLNEKLNNSAGLSESDIEMIQLELKYFHARLNKLKK